VRSIYVASIGGSGGTTALCGGLALALRRRGLDDGYLEAVGKVAGNGPEEAVDEDRRFVADVLRVGNPAAAVCRVELVESVMAECLDVDRLVADPS